MDRIDSVGKGLGGDWGSLIVVPFRFGVWGFFFMVDDGKENGWYFIS